MAKPRILDPIDIEVAPETGTLFQDVNGHYFGDVLISFMDALAKTMIQVGHLGPDELPVFVTQNVTAEALGYHSAYTLTNPTTACRYRRSSTPAGSIPLW